MGDHASIDDLTRRFTERLTQAARDGKEFTTSDFLERVGLSDHTHNRRRVLLFLKERIKAGEVEAFTGLRPNIANRMTAMVIFRPTQKGRDNANGRPAGGDARRHRDRGRSPRR